MCFDRNKALVTSRRGQILFPPGLFDELHRKNATNSINIQHTYRTGIASLQNRYNTVSSTPILNALCNEVLNMSYSDLIAFNNKFVILSKLTNLRITYLRHKRMSADDPVRNFVNQYIATRAVEPEAPII
jgi:hypothetical protein